MHSTRLFTVLIASACIVVACTPTPPGEQPLSRDETAAQILSAIKAKDMQTLADFAHPTNGVRFTPQTHVEPGTDLTFQAADIANFMEDTQIYTWGIADGSGEPIDMTFSQYYDRYVFDHDFTQAPQVNWNEPFDRGTIIDNAHEAYPDAEIVEYHFPGFDPQYGGMDWASLRLVLEQEGDVWHLVGIIHDRWSP